MLSQVQDCGLRGFFFDEDQAIFQAVRRSIDFTGTNHLPLGILQQKMVLALTGNFPLVARIRGRIGFDQGYTLPASGFGRERFATQQFFALIGFEKKKCPWIPGKISNLAIDAHY
jgi:hypothetical protein